ncbi:SchA/CurD-like domain-containing protein [Streptomyces violaceoruber]|uniref:SchA/CurD-like domain-containing protein n=1 Tax=Streptomyces TaxID=1883 RepID=UPI00109E962C|nr:MULTISPECIES: SchA/CurD-like domain-containing protein [Streptomyces]MDX3318308.1 SchA/CurD-like domain-containing protein [Streptomyces sp. ME03-5684b]THA96632.1 TcmI family type II polyketide cyclase [Streptomyces sp. LRa12]WTC11238.1 antibiotic biosynthesis monooxygenase [Streptomyces anthocyanicus]WTE18548.1 antibiotic biosynthesis monooxygenase [Streptomyces anthocyanicus]
MTVSPVVATDAPSTDATRTTATSATSPAVATDAGGVSISAFDGSRVRVVLMLDVHDGMQQEFLDAYERIRDRVAAVPGHVSDQLCQSLENPTQWLLTSEWESAAPFLAWVNSDEHLDTVEPLATCVRDTHSLRYSVLRETDGGCPAPGEPRSAPRIGDNVVRHALTFTVRPGTEAETARLLSEYVSPDAHVDGSTRLLRTSLFMSGNRIVRAVEVRGDLQTALRHVARQPGVRAVEEALNPYLEQDRDLGDPQSARRFFTRAAMPAVHHATYPDRSGARRERLALLYPVRDGAGPDLARLLARQDAAAARNPDGPVLAATVFHRDDLVVRLVDVDGDPEDAPAEVLGLHGRGAADAERLLDAAAVGVDGSPAEAATLSRLLRRIRMTPLTDRRSAGS